MKKKSHLTTLARSQRKPARATHPGAKPLHCAYLSLGSNLGNSRALIAAALGRLSESGAKAVRISSFYKTEPVDYLEQPWFINCVAEIRTLLSPRALMRACLSAERALGRRRSKPKGPRKIDIDILLYENIVVRRPGLTIPHPRMTERRFVLVPLRELAPRAVHPVKGETVSALLRRTGDSCMVVKL